MPVPFSYARHIYTHRIARSCQCTCCSVLPTREGIAQVQRIQLRSEGRGGEERGRKRGTPPRSHHYDSSIGIITMTHHYDSSEWSGAPHQGPRLGSAMLCLVPTPPSQFPSNITLTSAPCQPGGNLPACSDSKVPSFACCTCFKIFGLFFFFERKSKNRRRKR